MGKKEKLLKKILSGTSDKSITFDEVVSVLQNEGFVLEPGKGSHTGFRHPDGRKLTIPKHGKEVKPVYIKMMRNLIKIKSRA